MSDRKRSRAVPGWWAGTRVGFEVLAYLVARGGGDPDALRFGELDGELAERLLDVLTDELTSVGLDARSEPNAAGHVVEDLIDQLTLSTEAVATAVPVTDAQPVIDAVRLLVHAASEHPHRRDRIDRARDRVESTVLDLDDALQSRTGVRLSWWDDGMPVDGPAARPRPDGYGVTVHLRPRAGRQKKLHRALVAELSAHTDEPPGELRSRDGYDLLTDLLHHLMSDLAERLDHGVETELVARRGHAGG